MKGWLLIFLLFLATYAYAVDTSSSSLNWLTKNYADSVYCKNYGDCSLNSLNVSTLISQNVSQQNINVTNAIFINGTNIYDIFKTRNNSNYFNDNIIMNGFGINDTGEIKIGNKGNIYMNNRSIFFSSDLSGLPSLVNNPSNRDFRWTGGSYNLSFGISTDSYFRILESFFLPPTLTINNKGNLITSGNISSSWVNATYDVCITSGNCLSSVQGRNYTALSNFSNDEDFYNGTQVNQSIAMNVRNITNTLNLTNGNDFYNGTQVNNSISNIIQAINRTNTLNFTNGANFVNGTTVNNSISNYLTSGVQNATFNTLNLNSNFTMTSGVYSFRITYSNNMWSIGQLGN